MATDREHREAAERILTGIDEQLDTSDPEQQALADHLLRIAQVHATLALGPQVPMWENERVLTAANAAYDEVLDTLPGSDPDLNRKSMAAALKAAAEAEPS